MSIGNSNDYVHLPFLIFIQTILNIINCAQWGGRGDDHQGIRVVIAPCFLQEIQRMAPNQPLGTIILRQFSGAQKRYISTSLTCGCCNFFGIG